MSSRAIAAAQPARRPSAPRWLPSLVGATLLLAGLGLLGSTLLTGRAPVDRVPFDERRVEAPTDPALDEPRGLVPGATLEPLELVARPTGAVAATATLLRRPDGPPVLIGWRSGLAEPVLYPEIAPGEELRLVQALRRHLPHGARGSWRSPNARGASPR